MRDALNGKVQMQGRVYDPPALPAAFWTRPDVKKALEANDFGALFRLVYQQDISQVRICTATGRALSIRGMT